MPLLVEYKKVATYGKQVMALDKLIADHTTATKAHGQISGSALHSTPAALDTNIPVIPQPDTTSPHSTASFSTGESGANTNKSLPSSKASTVDEDEAKVYSSSHTTVNGHIIPV